MAKKQNPNDVLMIRDPFQMKNLEIQDAQNSSNELELDQDLEDFVDEVSDSDDSMNRLSEKLSADQPKSGFETLEREITPESLERDLMEESALAEEETEDDPELLAALPKINSDGDYDLEELESCIEALLFVSDKPLSAKKIKELLAPDYSGDRFREAIAAIKEKYAHAKFGIEIVNVAGGYEFRTKPGRAALAKRLAKVQAHRLSRGAMESLAIIAYRQPTMKEDIDAIRGVDSSHFLRTLLEKELIHISGRSELPGRPMLYKTTQTFLEVFGLEDLSAMPPLKEIESMIPTSSVTTGEEDPQVQKLRSLVSQMNLDRERITYHAEEDEKILTEIREKVKAIPVSTPSLDAEKVAAKEAKEAAEALKAGVPQVEEKAVLNQEVSSELAPVAAPEPSPDAPLA